MPTYEYVCDACNHEFEHFQSMTSAVLKKCPECGKLKLRRLIGTGSAVIFKGGGFYETDYRSEGYKKSAEADKKSAEGEKKSDSKADSKPDTKAETKSDKKTETKASKPDRKPNKPAKKSDSKAKKAS